MFWLVTLWSALLNAAHGLPGAARTGGRSPARSVVVPPAMPAGSPLGRDTLLLGRATEIGLLLGQPGIHDAGPGLVGNNAAGLAMVRSALTLATT